jgi:hypothetical protein
MKRIAVLAGMLAIAALSLSAAVWDGSAVVGGSGDFPGDGLFGACNSFPRDTSVTLTNLENGKTIVVSITRNVDNPGVFIALSPKAAEALGMHSGASARIRAVALTASQADPSLPAPRAGQSSDPDFNPKVYVAREKAAIAAAAESAQPIAASQPDASAGIAGGEESASAAPAKTIADAEETALASIAQEEPASEIAESPSLPASTPPPVTTAESPAAREDATALAPEILGGGSPTPRKTELARGMVNDSSVPAPPSESSSATTAVEKASVEALARPSPSPEAGSSSLSEPAVAIVPDQLPDATLNRIVAPAITAPVPVLAEARALEDSSSPAAGPEALAFEKPSYAAAVGAAALAESSPPNPSETYETEEPAKAGEGEELAELQTPDLPTPTESIASDKPKGTEAASLSTNLANPEATEPSPTESMAAEKPVASEEGDTTVALEPAEARPPVAVAIVPAPEAEDSVKPIKTETQPQTAPVASLASPSSPARPPASVPLLKGLSKGSFYVQIGVYGTNDSLKKAIAGFRSTYPLAVESVATKKGNAAYRLFVGPLGRDESGVVLMRIRSLGFRDAYVKQGS